MLKGWPAKFQRRDGKCSGSSGMTPSSAEEAQRKGSSWSVLEMQHMQKPGDQEAQGAIADHEVSCCAPRSNVWWEVCGIGS